MIVIEPANPQVVYVPQYDPSVVYYPSPYPAAAVGAMAFTAGVIIGHSSDHYYYGPYGWYGGAMYDEAWEHREECLEERGDLAQQRQSAAQDWQAQRQTGLEDRQAQRQTGREDRQVQRQTGLEPGQAERRSAAATSSFGGAGGAAQRSGMSAGQFSGYQRGSAVRAESMRGRGSLSSARGFGGGRRR